MLHATCYMLHATCYILHATCYKLHATCYKLHATCYKLHVTCYKRHATCYMIHATNFMLHDTCYMLHATNFMLHATCYMLPATCYLLHATSFFDYYGSDWCPCIEVYVPLVYFHIFSRLFFLHMLTFISTHILYIVCFHVFSVLTCPFKERVSSVHNVITMSYILLLFYKSYHVPLWII